MQGLSNSGQFLGLENISVSLEVLLGDFVLPAIIYLWAIIILFLQNAATVLETDLVNNFNLIKKDGYHHLIQRKIFHSLPLLQRQIVPLFVRLIISFLMLVPNT